jgi:hypothetical protein
MVLDPEVNSVISVDTLMRRIAKADASNPSVWDAKIKSHIADGTMPADTDSEALRQSILSDAHTVSLTTEAHLETEFANARPLFEQFVATRHWNVFTCGIPLFNRATASSRTSQKQAAGGFS